MGGGEYDRAQVARAGARRRSSSPAVAPRSTARSRPGPPRRAPSSRSTTARPTTSPTNITLAASESLTIQARERRAAAPAARRTARSPILTAGAGRVADARRAARSRAALRIEGDLDTLRLLHTHARARPVGRAGERSRRRPARASSSRPVRPSAPINTRLEVQIAFSIVGALRMPSHIDEALAARLDRRRHRARTAARSASAVCDAAGTQRAAGAHRALDAASARRASSSWSSASESIFTGDVTGRPAAAGLRALLVRAARLGRRRSSIAASRRSRSRSRRSEGRPRRPRAAFRCRRAGRRRRERGRARGSSRPSRPIATAGPTSRSCACTCPVQIRTGAEDGSEMGAFCVLKQPQRESNLRIRLDEYLPVGSRGRDSST